MVTSRVVSIDWEGADGNLGDRNVLYLDLGADHMHRHV